MTSRRHPTQGRHTAGSPVTIQDVARRAGVSASTVSRILGGQTSRPRGRNAEAVDRAVRELGYRADTVARSMRTRTTAVIGVVIDNLLDPVFPGIVQAVSETLEQAGYAVVLGTAMQGPAQATRGVEAMLERRVDGLIIACSWPSTALGTSPVGYPVPVVLTNTEGPGVGLPQFGTDNLAGGRLAAEHLLGLGHRRIAYVGGPATAPFDAVRLAGIRAAIGVAGLEPTGLQVLAGDGTIARGHAVVRELLAARPVPTAVACYNDLTAIGVLRGLDEAGRRVPRDMSVIGFDDIAEAAWLEPALTTVHQETWEMGRLAAEALLRRLRGEPAGPTPRPPVRLPMTLRIRASTAPPSG